MSWRGQIAEFIFQEAPVLRKYLDNDEYDSGLKNLSPHPSETEIEEVAKGQPVPDKITLLEHIVLCEPCGAVYLRHYGNHPHFRTM